MSLFDTVHTSSYSTLIETTHLVPFSSYSELFSNVADFNLPNPHLAPSWVTAFEFCSDFSCQKTSFPGLSCGRGAVVLSCV